ncbi:MAG TPA: HAD family hydrolase [Kofleriaceae bacterium]|nr:HAD family hydrolase [Kofleriaceae bacterium]
MSVAQEVVRPGAANPVGCVSTARVARDATAPTGCRHCGQPGAVDASGFCGGGCRAVHEQLVGAGLARYYDLRGGPCPPAVAPAGERDRAWLPRLSRQVASAEVLRHLALDVRGLRSGGCVWLIEELFRREPGRLQIAVHPALSRVEMWVRSNFPLERFVSAVERFGYQLGPAPAPGQRRGDALLARLGACVALASASLLLGTARDAGAGGALSRALGGATWLLAALSLWTGGEVFFLPALRGLRRRAIVAELPLAIGLVCAAAGASRPAAAGFLAAVCLGGHALEQLILTRHRRRLFADEPGDGLLCRRVRDDQVEEIDCQRIRRGDQLLIGPGAIVPVAATVAAGPATAEIATDDLPARRSCSAGEPIPAGAWNPGRVAVRVVAAEPFSLDAMLASPRRAAAGARGSDRHASLLLVAGVGGAALWSLTGGGAGALEVLAAILLASSPAGLALAVARERVEARLRRSGVVVRRPDFLERVRAVRRVVFDRIGVVTATGPELSFPEALVRLGDRDRAALHHLAAHGHHPRCRAVLRALGRLGRLAILDGVAVREVPGGGVEADIAGARYRLGAPRWVVERGSAPSACLGFSRDGGLLAWLIADEDVRPSARAEVGALVAAGVEPWLISPGEPAQVAALAARLGIPPARALGDMKPPGKAAWLERVDRGDTLFVGDGINDGAITAHLVGAPVADRPPGAGPCDFYLTRPGLAPVTSALACARDLAAVSSRARRAAAIATAAVIATAALGALSPWMVAALMPAAALALTAMVTAEVGVTRQREPRLAEVATAAASA